MYGAFLETVSLCVCVVMRTPSDGLEMGTAACYQLRSVSKSAPLPGYHRLRYTNTLSRVLSGRMLAFRSHSRSRIRRVDNTGMLPKTTFLCWQTYNCSSLFASSCSDSKWYSLAVRSTNDFGQLCIETSGPESTIHSTIHSERAT